MKNQLLLILSAILLSSSFAGAAAPNTRKLNCKGTEPGWSIQVAGSDVNYSDFESKTSFFGAELSEAVGVAPGYAFQVNASREKGAKRISISVIKAGVGGCSDGMSESAYLYSVLANVNGTVLTGCCD